MASWAGTSLPSLQCLLTTTQFPFIHSRSHFELLESQLICPSLVNSTAFETTFNSPSPTITGLIVAIYEVGCFLGSVATSIFGESLGRKKSILIGVIIMIIGAVLQASSYGRPQMVVARVVSGVGMGWINSTVPVFQAEFSPKATRGLCMFSSPCFLFLWNSS
jgi:MFS family permease